MLAESALRRNIVDSVVAHAWWKHRCVWLGRWRVLVCCVALCCDCAGRGEVSELGRAEAMMRGSFAWCSRTDGPVREVFGERLMTVRRCVALCACRMLRGAGKAVCCHVVRRSMWVALCLASWGSGGGAELAYA